MGEDLAVVKSIQEAITQGSYPESEELLTTDLSKLIPTLLPVIIQTQNDLNEELKAASRTDADGVDQWITQAKLIQEEIARYTLESRKIVEEHAHIEALRTEAADHQAKVDLLETEIRFTKDLKDDLSKIAVAAQSLKEVEQDLLKDDPIEAARKLRRFSSLPSPLSKSRPTIMTRDLKDELKLKTRVRLEAKLNDQIQIRREQHLAWLEVSPTETVATEANSDSILNALEQLDEPHEALESLMDKLRSFLLVPLRKTTRLKFSSYHFEEHKLSIELGQGVPSFETVFDFVSEFLEFLHTFIAKTVQDHVVKAILPDLMALLVTDWLTPELPVEIEQLSRLDQLRQQMNRLLDQLSRLEWQGQAELQTWTNQINRIWLNKRKAATLDAVRKGLASAKGILRQVERIETRIVPIISNDFQQQEQIPDEWEANWDDDAKEESSSSIDAKAKENEDDDASGWGFDDDENESKDKHDHTEDSQQPKGGDGEGGEEEEEDAWGWGDEESEKKKPQSHGEPITKSTNGHQKAEPGTVEQEQTLSEWYSISEVPDYIIEAIGKDLSDAETLKTIKNSSLDTSVLSRGLLTLPTLSLAMFRATASSYYGASPSLTDIHRYNDSLYIVDRLRDLDTSGLPNADADIKAMEKFARLAYSKEMETQRLIVWDLLEGAQGFTSCTKFPYSQEIDNAVTAVVDRIRSLHMQWQPILSPSVLLQSIGAIVAMVTGKVIFSIEELDDISEPESRKLTDYCQQIAALDDLFPREDSATGFPVSSTPVYVSSWFRFQYLIQILDSSLVDIRYLWTEGELSLEFSQKEVVSFVEALFAESRHRKEAINAIRAKSGPWDT